MIYQTNFITYKSKLGCGVKTKDKKVVDFYRDILMQHH